MSKLKILDGINIGFQRWGAGNPQKILCLHGWLDNSNSFSVLGRHLAATKKYEVVAIDHLGHGLSDHLRGHGNAFTNYVIHVRGVMDVLGWEKPHLIGHSMGAIISTFFSGTHPERVGKLTLIEAIGPTTRTAEDAAKVLRTAVDAQLAFIEKSKSKKPPKQYPKFADLVEARMHAVTKYPGEQSISREAARIILGRGAELSACANKEGLEEHQDVIDDAAGPVQLRHDMKLHLPTQMEYTEVQVLSFLRKVKSSTLLITGTKGWPFKNIDERKAVFGDHLVAHHVLEGSHHLHLDPGVRDDVCSKVLEFLEHPDRTILAEEFEFGTTVTGPTLRSA